MVRNRPADCLGVILDVVSRDRLVPPLPDSLASRLWQRLTAEPPTRARVALLNAVLFVALAPLAGFPFSGISWPLLVLVLGAAALALTAMGFMIAWALDSIQGYHVVMNLVLFPLWILSGAMFPTGKPMDDIDGIDVSCVDIAMPMMIARAADLGISGYEEFRDDLTLMYFPRLDPSSGRLLSFEMVPMQIRHFRLLRASAADAGWLAETLDRESRVFGCGVAPGAEGTLSVRWNRAAR